MSAAETPLQQTETKTGHTLRIRWLIWLLPTLLYAISHFHRIAPTVIFDDLMVTFGASGATLGALGSIYFYVYAVMQVPSGIFADTLGPRKTITAGALIGGLGSFVFGLAGTLWQAYLGRFLVGFGVSLIFICIMKLAAEWFEDHEFATVSGLTLFGGNLGSILATTPLYLLVAAIGWRSSFKVIALVTVLLGCLTWLLVRDRPSAPGRNAAKQAGGGTARAAAHTPTMSISRGFVETMGNKKIWPIILMSFGMYGTIVALKGMWLTPYLTQVYSLSREQATYYVLLSMVAGVIGPLLMGLFSDRIRRRKLPILLVTPLYLLTWLTIAFWNGGKPPLPMLAVLLFLLGIFCSPMALTWACAKEVSHPALVGLATGLANIGGFLGGAMMQYLYGYILDAQWRGVIIDGVRIYSVQAYQSVFFAASAVVLLSLLGTFFIPETHCKNIYNLRPADTDDAVAAE